MQSYHQSVRKAMLVWGRKKLGTPEISSTPIIITKDSPVHGIGVFAEKDLDIGEQIGLYDGFDIPIEKCNFNQINHNHTFTWPHMYNKSLMRFGFSKQQKVHGILQFCNDAAKPNFKKTGAPVVQLKKEIIEEYKTLSQSGCNLIILPDFTGLVIRPIKKGEEVFLTYDFQYWVIEHMCGKQANIYEATKMAFYNYEDDLNWNKSNKKLLVSDDAFKQFLQQSQLERYKEYKIAASETDEAKRLQILAKLVGHVLNE